MNKLHKYIYGNRHTIYLIIIVLSLGGSMLMMAIQGSRVSQQAIQLQKQNETLKEQVAAITAFNSARDKAVADLKADNAKQTAYLACLLELQGVPVTDQVKSDCERRATTAEQQAQQQSYSFDTQKQSAPQSGESGSGNNSGGSGSNNPQPQQGYGACVSSGRDILHKVGRVISCL